MKRLSIARMWPMRGENFHAASLAKYLAGGAILFSLFALSWPFVAVNSQSGGFSVEYDTDRRYGDYKNYDVSGGHEVCRDACANDAKCKAYRYTKPWQGYSAHCWLKDSVPAPESGLTCCISGVKGGGGGGADGCSGGYNIRAPSSVAAGSRITIRFGYSGAQPGQDAWIGLFPVGSDKYLEWYGVKAMPGCEGSFAAPGPGNYEFRYLLDSGYDKVAARASITVQ